MSITSVTNAIAHSSTRGAPARSRIPTSLKPLLLRIPTHLQPLLRLRSNPIQLKALQSESSAEHRTLRICRRDPRLRHQRPVSLVANFHVKPRTESRVPVLEVVDPTTPTMIDPLLVHLPDHNLPLPHHPRVHQSLLRQSTRQDLVPNPKRLARLPSSMGD